MVTPVTFAAEPIRHSLIAMNRLSTRPGAVAAFVVLCLAVIACFLSSSRAQEQPGIKRQIVNRVEPVYPELARKMLIRGTVKVEVVVAPSGKAKSTHVTGGNPVLAQAALDAIEKWRWVPAPQESRELIELSFVP